MNDRKHEMMRTVIFTSLITALALSACQRQPSPETTQAEVPKIAEAKTPTETPVVDAHVTEKITALGIASVMRQSATQDKDGKFVAPFTDAKVHFVTSSSAPKVGANIFMWPLRNAPQPMNIKITDVQSGEACNGGQDQMHAVTGTPENMTDILSTKTDTGRSAESPFDFAYIIPSQPKAKLVQPPTTLPPGVTIATVKFALDLNDDGHADAMYVTSDCDTGAAVTAETGATCTASYVLKESKWVLLDSTSPC